MVESTPLIENKTQEAEPQGDGLVRNVIYGKMRTEKEASPGYSAEIVHHELDAAHYDNLEAMPELQTDLKTIFHHFESTASKYPDSPFLGTRAQLADGKFGEYEWKSFKQVHEEMESLAKGMHLLDLCPDIEGEEGGPKMRFTGIWSKNREEWHITELASMKLNSTVVGFYDAMSDKAVDYIIKQCQFTTIVGSAAYLAKVVNLKKQSMATSIVNVVLFDGSVSEEARAEATEQGLTVHMYKDVVAKGREHTEPIEFPVIGPQDLYQLCYTSGTTGDSKGVKCTHWGLLASALVASTTFQFGRHDTFISYLPSPHVFDQYMFACSCMYGAKIGYYQGDPLKLMEDCAVLGPTIFPSVPRLYNKIYGKIKGQFDALTGCKKWLVNSGLSSKQHYLNQDAAVTHGCYDKLVFGKIKGLLGGNVRLMITASAPIDHNVLDFLQVCFCCPMLEGYGLSESSGAASFTFSEDPLSGHVGGPVKSVKFRLKDVPEMQYLATDKPYPRGELCMQGPIIFGGYYKNQEKTSEAFDVEGWFQTGDVVQLYPNGTVKIIDRAKNIFKLSQGEYVAPEKLENIFVLSSYIAQSMIYGDSLKNCVIGVIVADPPAAKEFAKRNGMDENDLQAVVENADFKKELLDDIARLAKENKLTGLEKPKEIFITLDGFSVDNDMLTPTFKLKRNVCKQVYQDQIDKMYADLAARGI